MSNLFLNFCDNMDRSPNSKEFYNTSLKVQFEALQKRFPIDKQSSSFGTFIEACFPTMMPKKYFISCPNFLRERTGSEGGPSYLRNIVIRPEKTLSMRRYLPDSQNIILIGDIVEGSKLKMIRIKGIQTIDDNMSSDSDKVFIASVVSAFSQSTNNYGKSIPLWTFQNVDYNDTILTPNFVDDIIRSCYTVDNPAEVREVYDLWDKYFKFRDYYLEAQSERNFHLDSAEYIEAYAINRKDYRKNSSLYDDYILDNENEFTKGDMVVLSSKIEDAEPFPLVKLNIDRNKKAFNEAKVIKRGREVNEEERGIRSLASDNVFITSENPQSDSKFKDNGKTKKVTFGELLNAGYALGDRFKIVKRDISPDEHLAQLDYEYDVSLDSSYKRIDAKFEKIINDELNKATDDFTRTLNAETNKALSKKKQQLESSLAEDVKQNTDTKILKKIHELQNSIKAKINRELKKDKDESKAEFETRLNATIEAEQAQIDVKSLYIERNNKILEDYKKLLENENKKQISSYVQKKKLELKNKYQDDIRRQKVQSKEALDEKLKNDKKRVIEEETIIRFSLYFRLGDPNNNINNKQIEAIKKCQYIVYDSRAESAKIKRQKLALENFYSGYVKNPYLSTYLFNPSNLKGVREEYADWIWHLSSLNEKQKEAVRKAVSSNGIFLLQGPPGTGKTQVIAETVAQMVKKGKKVLISSETHKAIDNVFERLPKIAEIVPIRLIPSNNDKKKENEYDPKYLVDNFYENISSNMKSSVLRYKNFKQNKEEFSDKYASLKLLKSKIEKSQKVLDEANKKIAEYEKVAKDYNSQISLLNDQRDDSRIALDTLRRTKRHIEKNSLKLDEDVKTQLIISIRDDLEALFDKSTYLIDDLGNLIRNIESLKNEEIDRELAVIDPKASNTILEIRRKDIQAQMAACRDEFGDTLPGKEDEINNLKNELRQIVNKINASEETSNLSDLKLSAIFNYGYLIQNIDSIKNTIEANKTKIKEIKAEYYEKVNAEISAAEVKVNDLDEQINKYKKLTKGITDAIIEIQDRDDVKEINDNKYKLENDLVKFFKDFEISEPFKDIDEALNIIKEKWNELESDFTRKEAENKEKIPMYEKISNYLSSEDVIEDDRKKYTKDLFDNANVFGITCTSNDRFSGRNVDALSEYNIDDIDIKSVGIDVVIIDEVSKSSFIDLLIPILYGKTVILVGDHRQLPPMYEFSKLRDDDFEGLDSNIINKEINKKFTELYETCFFKSLFEKIPDSYKTMLVQQYRCHEHIMHVFNHFYQGELELGFKGQNNNKRHNIKLVSNGRNIIIPEKHVYFVDCKKNETHEQDSTSMYNTGEAMVIAELIKKLNTFFKQNPDREKLSIGVICTYGDQARKIKEYLKSEKVKTDAFKTDVEKMIVSTVDDFQGDERDIIILSTVRNPENHAKSNPGFILAYQRINVALSRARRLLVMVGNRKYLESKGLIDLPDVNGRGRDQRNFRVYEEILSTIETYGSVVEDTDILEDKEAIING